MSLGEQATAAPAAGSTDRRHQQCCRRASLTPSAHEQAASCHESTEHLQSEHTCGSGAGAHRGAVTACLEERRSHARSWRKPSIQVSIPPAVSIPQQHDTFSATAGRRSGRLSSGKKNDTAREQGSTASAVSASDADMRRSDANPRLRVTSPAGAPYAPRLRCLLSLHEPD